MRILEYEVLESRVQVRDFVRFTIVDQKQKEIGMVEICPSYKYSADGSSWDFENRSITGI